MIRTKNISAKSFCCFFLSFYNVKEKKSEKYYSKYLHIYTCYKTSGVQWFSTLGELSPNGAGFVHELCN